uniref:AMP-dependent synthetase/ligase domain-containing protein n=1 Tax=Anopheles culicifacies TaxID=139723 RepID=A0A182LZA4_9DIPT
MFVNSTFSNRVVYDTETRTWHGPTVKSVFNPEASLGQVIVEVLDRSPDRVIQQDMDTGRSLTYAEFKTRLVRFAQNLTSYGVCKGDMVTLANANSENLAPLACALLTIGVPLNPLAPGFNEDDMANMLQTTKPKLVFCDADNYEVVRKALQRVVPKENQMPPIYVFECSRSDVNHAEDFLKETGQEETFIAIYWATGFSTMLNTFFNGAIRVITRKPFNEQQFFEAIEKYRADVVFTPPAYASAVLAHPRIKTIDFSHLRLWAVGGSPVPEQLRDRIDELLAPTGGRSVNGIGTSEVGGVALDLIKRKPGFIGPLMPNVMIRIVDEDGTRLGVGEQGEVLMKACYEFGGYYGNEEASKSAIDADGFFRSGDIGYIDEEGFLCLIDRKKDIFKYRNFHVSPTDLEAIILRIDGVQNVCVVGVPDADGATDLPAAAIVRRPGAVLDAAQVCTFVDGQVSDFKRLRGGVYFVEQLPKTDSGKVLRRLVTKMIGDMNQHPQRDTAITV